ncbi:MAG: acyltransferase, partial [Acidimicrobiia bacterium]
MTSTLQRDRSRLAYQPALDGLRAVAVLAVLLYHHHHGGGWGRLGRGGFLGVDVFFVLSGYLITTILLRAQTDAGTVDLGRFWTRRARRLIPALLTMLLFAVIVAHASVPDLQGALRGDLLYAIFYVENWHIALWHGPELSTITHTWSLSVEEQFYIVWPIVLIGLAGLTRSRLRRMLPIVVVLAIGSALWT